MLKNLFKRLYYLQIYIFIKRILKICSFFFNFYIFQIYKRNFTYFDFFYNCQIKFRIKKEKFSFIILIFFFFFFIVECKNIFVKISIVLSFDLMFIKNVLIYFYLMFWFFFVKKCDIKEILCISQKKHHAFLFLNWKSCKILREEKLYFRQL